MLIQQRAPRGAVATKSLTLTFDQRKKSRLRTMLDDGTPAALMLPRGTILRGGDKLLADNGLVIIVRAADELVSTAHAPDPSMLPLAAYHLGNRHVALQIGEGWVRYQHDHVLDDLVTGLGLEIAVGHAPFEPEGGSHSGGHRHSHAHDHADGHELRHAHGDEGRR